MNDGHIYAQEEAYVTEFKFQFELRGVEASRTRKIEGRKRFIFPAGSLGDTPRVRQSRAHDPRPSISCKGSD